MRRRPVTYSAQDVLDYLDGNFAIPEDGFESDIEGLESDSDDDLEPEIIQLQDILEPYDDEIDLRNDVIENDEADVTDNNGRIAAVGPNNYSLGFTLAQLQRQ